MPRFFPDEEPRAWAALRPRTQLAIGAAFAASRAIFFAVGIRFDTARAGVMWQLLDPALLRDRLGESLLYLHAQPPLYNLAVGLASANVGAIMHAVHLALGLALALSLGALARRLGLSERASALVAVGFSVSPAAVLYENLLFYTAAEPALLVSAALFLHRFAASRRARDAAAFFALLGALVLLRSVFHLAFLALVTALLALAAGSLRRRVLLAAAPALVVTSLWYAKNLALFGTFSASSWVGMNLARVALETIPAADRADLVARGALPPIARHAPFRHLDSYGTARPRRAPTGVPALDQAARPSGQPNFNHAAYLDLSRRFLGASFAAMRARPLAYASGVGRAFDVGARSPSDYWILGANAAKITPYTRAFEGLFYGRLVGRWCLFLIVASPIALARAAFVSLGRGARAIDPAAAVTLLFLTGTAAYATLVSNLLDVGENNRFRFAIDPILLVLIALAVRDAARWIADRRRGSR